MALNMEALMSKLSNLEQEYDDQNPDNEEFLMVVGLLNKNDSRTTSVDMRYKSLSRNQVSTVCTALQKNTAVKSLLLTGNEIGEQGIQAIATMLSMNGTIEELELRFCGIGSESMPLLTNMVKTHRPVLKKLQLLGNDLSDEEVAEIANIVKDLIKTETKSPTTTKKAEEPKTPSTTKALSPVPSPSDDSITKRSPSGDANDIGANRALKEKIEELMAKNQILANRITELESTDKTLQEKEKHNEQVVSKRVEVHLQNIQINEQIAEIGGSGAAVFSCLVDGWQCAMKEMELEGVSDEAIANFQTEIELLEKLPFHPNIVRYLFHIQKGTKLRLFMTKYSSSLRKSILRKRKEREADGVSEFSEKAICKWSLAVATGLEFLHKQNVIHRDMKPDNVLTTYDVHGDLQTLAITDFDTAKLMSKSTLAKSTIGTPAYMAPEVITAANEGKFTQKSDVWAMGMIIYELMTLKEPYEDEDAFDVPMMIQAGTRPQFPLKPDRYEHLKPLYESCTMKDPADRPDISELRTRLQQLNWEL